MDVVSPAVFPRISGIATLPSRFEDIDAARQLDKEKGKL